MASKQSATVLRRRCNLVQLSPGLCTELFNEHLSKDFLYVLSGNCFLLDFADLRVFTLGSSDAQGVALTHFALAVFSLGAREADRTHEGLPAGIGATGPMDFELFG